MVVTGDPTQIDLPPGHDSGLADAVGKLEGLAEIGVVRFDRPDVVRHPLVSQIIHAYDAATPVMASEGHVPAAQGAPVRKHGQ